MGLRPSSWPSRRPRRIGEGKQTHDISLERGLPQHTARIAPSWNKVNSNRFLRHKSYAEGTGEGVLVRKLAAGRQVDRLCGSFTAGLAGALGEAQRMAERGAGALALSARPPLMLWGQRRWTAAWSPGASPTPPPALRPPLTSARRTQPSSALARRGQSEPRRQGACQPEGSQGKETRERGKVTMHQEQGGCGQQCPWKLDTRALCPAQPDEYASGHSSPERTCCCPASEAPGNMARAEEEDAGVQGQT